ncbi:uncharacterized protein LOC111708182 [Eurytemora carolleeae]|uniref:uncharacterized protein LOC111708182 n=1 Tax=Eurytemora carolleeae TaxID=1294199 RepID=UPI000C781703|nr:uncharacterized protein LOC111708182 [Eurytemora carolleeae]|eukprot:XP_023337248.1 uncharacterized protein LOC111708182 [Eurytemora affinis]
MVSLSPRHITGILSGALICIFSYQVYNAWKRQQKNNKRLKKISANTTDFSMIFSGEKNDSNEYSVYYDEVQKIGEDYPNDDLDEKLVEGVYSLVNSNHYKELLEYLHVPWPSVVVKVDHYFEARRKEPKHWSFRLQYSHFRNMEWESEFGKVTKGSEPETDRPLDIVCVSVGHNRIVTVRTYHSPLSSGFRTLLSQREFNETGFVQTMTVKEFPGFKCQMFWERTNIKS